MSSALRHLLLAVARLVLPNMLFPGLSPGKEGGQRSDAKRSLNSQCARERPATLRLFEACLTVVQVSTPAWSLRLGVGYEIVSDDHHAKQAGLNRPHFAANAGAYRKIPRPRRLRSHGHSSR